MNYQRAVGEWPRGPENDITRCKSGPSPQLRESAYAGTSMELVSVGFKEHFCLFLLEASLKYTSGQMH
jgi:hypothetical protein